MSTTGTTTRSDADLAFQTEILQQVSQTYAMTIPLLPPQLRHAVTNGYLLCRIADSIEDDPDMALADKENYLHQFAAIVAAEKPAGPFAGRLAAQLGPTTPESVRRLVRNSEQVIRVTLSFESRQRKALERCIRVMSTGMLEFQQYENSQGLKDIAQLERYCYFVAGVVGEMLAELFCAYSTEIDKRSEQLQVRSVSCGKGVQLTNIIKDIWDDQREGMCWLPRDLFLESGFDLNDLAVGQANPGFSDGLVKLIAVARNHLLEGLGFALAIPSSEYRIRRQIVSSLGLSALMLRKVYFSETFDRGEEISLSKTSVRNVVGLLNLLARSDVALRTIFFLLTRPLPKVNSPQTASEQQ
ncbi:MAG: squalene/phytoene synthase family protein [Acidiferrobacterales bacterium]|nr:squalene/phytoene synthase family protein [Acidiferrobacterales bacterium]